MKQFNVIYFNFNAKKFETYDIIPYFVRKYHEHVEQYDASILELEAAKTEEEIEIAKSNLDYWRIPQTVGEFKKFIQNEARDQFWSRCEYEIILVDWPCQKTEEKWDVYDQIMMNLDIITQLVMEEVFI